MRYKELFITPNRVQLGLTAASLTGIKHVWFKIENRLPYCVKKAF